MGYFLKNDQGTWPLAPGINILGRQPDCSVQMTDPYVSRRHLSIDLLGDGSLTLMDLGSSNGLFVQGKRTPNAILHPGDAFLIGKTTFQIHLD